MAEADRADYDSPWKEALDRYFEPFLGLLFPEAHAGIDWLRGYEMLDKELQQIVRQGETGRLTVDKLVRVWRRTGEEEWILIHVEVQTTAEAVFPRRAYAYHSRLFDRYDRPVVTFVVLGDDRAGWRPNHFAYNLWGCGVDFRFPTAKLLDWAADEERLERLSNVFAPIVLAHVKATQTGPDDDRRGLWKVRVVRGLYQRGLGRDEILELYRLVDWIMKSSIRIEQQVRQEIEAIEQEQHMPYVSYIEQVGMEKGREEGRAEGRRAVVDAIELALKLKFGPSSAVLMPQVRQLSDLPSLCQMLRSIETATSVDDIRGVLPTPDER